MPADRHLLIGLLALQNGIINQVQLVAAFQAWTLDRSSSLADQLTARVETSPAPLAYKATRGANHFGHSTQSDRSQAVNRNRLQLQCMSLRSRRLN